jgi:hypothetical protein
VQLLDPGGERLLSLTQTRSARAVPLDRLGFFTLQRGGAERPIPVNPDLVESDLRPMDAGELERWRSDLALAAKPPVQAAGGADPQSGAPLGTPLARGLVWLLVIAALLEPGLASRLHGTRPRRAAQEVGT